MKNRITELLDIKYPVFQGGMAWIAEATLASAVSNAGGLGIIAAGNAPANVIRNEIRRARTLTNRPFGVNIMLLSPFADDVARICCDERVPVVTTGAGMPTKFIGDFKALGIKIIPIAPSVAIAKRLEKSGADAIIAEGMEAGGHIGKLTSMTLVPQLADAVKIPVVGAGGVADGRGMAAMFILGACGVQIGTRFVTALESIAHRNYKNMILKAKDIDTVITGSLTGHPVRSLRNKLTKQFDEAEKEELLSSEPNSARLDELGAGALRKAVIDGDVEFGSVMAGQTAGMVCKEQSCRDIIEEIMAEFRRLMGTGDIL